MSIKNDKSIEISFISINYNGLYDTRDLIESIIRIVKDVTYEIIIIDNASSNNEWEQLCNGYKGIRCIKSEKNLGFAGANNIGIAEAKGEYLYFVNNDTLIIKDDIRNLINRLRQDDKVGVACPKILFYNPKNHIQFAGYTELTPITLRNKLIGFNEKDIGQYAKAHTSPYMHGAAMLVSRKVIEKAGMIPENYFLYYEELDWSERIKEAGFEIWYEPLSSIYHKESQSVGQNSPIRTYYLTRNRLRFAQRNRKGIVRIMSILYQIAILAPFYILKNLLMMNFNISWAYLKGIIDYITNKV